MQQHHANYSTLLLLTLKELRLDRNIHQGQLAQSAGKSPNAWTKIESGQSALTIDGFLGACHGLQLFPSTVMMYVERLIPLFNNMGWFFQAIALGEGEDELQPIVNAYFNSRGFEEMKKRPFEKVAITSVGSPFAQAVVPTVVRYCCEPQFREWFDQGAQLSGVDASAVAAHPITFAPPGSPI